MKRTRIFGASPVGKQARQIRRVSPKKYLQLSELEKNLIASTRILAPKLGEKASFGHIELTYK